MARSSADFQTFTPKADAGGNLATTPFDDGSEFKVAAQVFEGLGNQLGQIADKAVAASSYLAAQKEAEAGIGIPEVTFKLKPGAVAAAGGTKAAAAPGAPAQSGYYERLAHIESGGNPNARNKDSGAAGLYQFVPSTARQYGLKNPYDPAQAHAAVVRLTEDNRATLSNALGRPPSDGELYLAHQQGAGGAIKLLRNPDTSAAAIVGEKAVTQNGGTAGMTAKQFASQWTGKFSGAPSGKSADVIGGSVLPGPAGAPATPAYDMQVTVPPPQPLALRRDGTIAGDAHDNAIAETAAWKMQLGLDAELGAAFENHKDDPAAFQQEVKTVADKYVKQAQAIGPEVSLKIKDRAAGQLLTYARDVQARNEKQVDEERKTAALAAVDQATTGLSRQAYLIGVNQDGDERLSALAAQANQSIDAALASGAITGPMALQQRQTIASGLVTNRIQGVYDALPDVAARRHFVDGLDAQYADPKSPLAQLQPETFLNIKRGLATAVSHEADQTNAASALDKFTLKRSLADDLASMKATGQGADHGGKPLDPQDVARMLGPEDTAKWLDERAANRQIFEATHTMAQKSNADIEATLAQLQPKPGQDGFAQQEKVFTAADKQAKEIVHQRREDPAAAAELTYPQIAKIEDPHQRAMARMDAQGALGLSHLARQPLTRDEAKGLADRLNLVENDPDALTAEMQALMADTQNTYGTLADDVMIQVLGETGIRKTTAQSALLMMQQLNLGHVPTAELVANYQVYRSLDMASAAMEGQLPPAKVQPKNGEQIPGSSNYRAGAMAKPTATKAVAPNAAQLQLLRSNPALAPQFDKKFGAGSADAFTKDRGDPVRRRLSDGSVELTYPDGFVETLMTTGEIKGRQGP